ncbi:MAG TPA: fatty acid desaturase [Gammaproteobacteria bacterium]|nr:fatty acid desaturase [Gammaproteobacteria bacterium]
MLNGFLNFPLWGDLLAALVFTHVTVVSVTVYLHRHQAHRALDLHPALAHFFRFWLWLTTGMVTREWVAVHRKHHAHCETEDDPHSPQVLGLRKVLWQGAELYRSAAGDRAMIDKFSRGTPDDWMERNVYLRHPMLGITLMALVDVALFGVAGISIWAVQMVWIPFWAAGVVNGIGHYFGYRNFECKDAATNFSPVGVLVGGEELHNNHHAFPGSAKFSQRRWEWDVGWGYIRLFQALRLARVRRVAPVPHIERGRSQLDAETVRAVLTNRLHVLRDYSSRVIRPVLSRERDNLGVSRLGRVRRLLVRDTRLLDEDSRTRLQRLLYSNSRLRTVYQHRERLKQIWESRATSYEHLVESLREWCAHAEATGIEALEDFSRRLRAYVPSATPATV